jgi:hypothetical protein
VGYSGKYLDWTIQWKELKDFRAGGLLKKLKADDVFGGFFKGVDTLGACTIAILKGALPAGQKLPTAADEAPDKVLELEGAETVGAVAESAGTGDQLCIRVHLPVEAAVQLPAAAVPRADRELLPACIFVRRVCRRSESSNTAALWLQVPNALGLGAMTGHRAALRFSCTAMPGHRAATARAQLNGTCACPPTTCVCSFLRFWRATAGSHQEV